MPQIIFSTINILIILICKQKQRKMHQQNTITVKNLGGRAVSRHKKYFLIAFLSYLYKMVSIVWILLVQFCFWGVSSVIILSRLALTKLTAVLTDLVYLSKVNCSDAKRLDFKKSEFSVKVTNGDSLQGGSREY